jgi:hypothetical protein
MYRDLVGDYDRHAGGHGLDDSYAEVLGIGRKDKYGGGFQCLEFFRLAKKTNPENGVRNAQFIGPPPKFCDEIGFAVTCNNQCGLGIDAAEFCEGWQKKVEALLAVNPREEKNGRPSGKRREMGEERIPHPDRGGQFARVWNYNWPMPDGKALGLDLFLYRRIMDGRSVG